MIRVKFQFVPDGAIVCILLQGDVFNMSIYQPCAEVGVVDIFIDLFIMPVRYQQVFDASEFAKLPPGGAFVSFFLFRPDCADRSSWIVTNLTVNLSTTSKRPDELSPVFEENTGPDALIVLTKASQGVGPVGNDCPKASPFFPFFILEIPFLYDPAKGNLLTCSQALSNDSILPGKEPSL